MKLHKTHCALLRETGALKTLIHISTTEAPNEAKSALYALYNCSFDSECQIHIAHWFV